MIQELIYKGKFKTPDNQDWYHGTLTYDPVNGAALEIFGTFNHWFFDRNSKPLIIGKTDNGDVTLIDNWSGKIKTFNEGGVLSVYKPNIIIDGHCYLNLEDITFEKTSFGVFNLFAWLSKTGQNRNDIYNSIKNFKIHYSEIPNIEFSFDKSEKGKISFESPIIFGDNSKNELKIFEDAYVTYEYDDKRKLEEILQDIYRFINSITLFTGEQSYPTNIILKTSSIVENNKTQISKSISCHYKNSYFNEKHKIKRRGEFLINYSDIENNYPNIIKNWFEISREIDSVINLVLKQYKNKLFFSTDNFMDTIRALENFHRIDHDNTRIPEENYNALVDEILNSVNLETKNFEWLQGKLKGNEPSLKTRIKALVKENDSNLINEKIGKLKTFCWKVTNARNYYTHYDRRLEKQAASGSELYELNETLRSILITSILRKIGIPIEKFENSLR